MIITAVAYAAAMQHSGCDCSKDQRALCQVTSYPGASNYAFTCSYTDDEHLDAIHIDNCITTFSTRHFLCSVLEVFAFSARPSLSLSTPRQSLTEPRTSESCETWAAAWTGPRRIHETSFRAGFAKWGVINSREFDRADHVWVQQSVSFPHTFTFTQWWCWCVSECCAQLQCVEPGVWWGQHLTPDLQTQRPKPDKDLCTSWPFWIECSSLKRNDSMFFVWEKEKSTVVLLGNAKSQSQFLFDCGLAV